MMCGEINSQFKLLEDFILNEDRVVTYAWLSKKLNVHVNTAKQLLYSFLKKKPSNHIQVTYILSGFLKNDNGMKILLVDSDNLAKAKESFDTISSEHVYSVQKTTEGSKFTDFSLVDEQCDGQDKCLSSIAPRNIEKRERTLIVPQKQVEPIKSNLQGKKETKNKQIEKDDESSSDNDESKPSRSSPRKKQNDKKGAIGMFFNKQSSKPKSSPVKKSKPTQKETKFPNAFISSSEDDDEKEEKMDNNVKKGTDNLKKPQSSKSKKSPTKKTKTSGKETKFPSAFISSSEDEDDKNEEVDSDDKEDADSAKDLKKPHKVSKVDDPQPKTPAGVKNNKKRKKSSKAKEQNAKRRRRIMEASDSESETSNDDMELEENMLDNDPVPEPVLIESDDEVIPPTPQLVKGVKKIRKQVVRMYTDEEGFMHTKKEFVFENCSDNEDETSKHLNEKEDENDSEKHVDKKEPVIQEKVSEKETFVSKTTPKKKGRKSKGTPEKKKQPSITNFFKRK